MAQWRGPRSTVVAERRDPAGCHGGGIEIRGRADRLAEAALAGAREEGAETLHLKARDVRAIPCQACGPDPTHGTGYCIYHDDMDGVYAALERATGVLVASPVHFSGLSSQLKLVI